MSGGISNVLMDDLEVRDSFVGILQKTTRGRGGYIKDIVISNIIMEKVEQAIKATGQWDTHPDDEFDPSALPSVSGITFKDIIGTDISTAGNFTVISESPFTSLCLSNIILSVTSNLSAAWVCSDVLGSSENVSPEPCPELQNMSSVSPSSLSKIVLRFYDFYTDKCMIHFIDTYNDKSSSNLPNKDARQIPSQASSLDEGDNSRMLPDMALSCPRSATYVQHQFIHI